MRACRSFRLGTLVLLATTVVTDSAIPTHDHRQSDGAARAEAVLLDGDHHDHGVLAVATAKRLASISGPALPPSTTIVVSWGNPLVVQPAPADRTIFPHERAPPPAQPRAPPASA